MTLSVLIPIYNYCARKLVEAVDALITLEALDAEIVVADDASTKDTSWLDKLHCTNALTLWRATHNLGRSAIRNQLARLAQGRWLWFVDCDTALAPSFSLKKYLEATTEADVVCGGLTTPVSQPPGCELRYRYELADSHRRTAEVRSQKPYRQLSTCNLLIKKNVFADIQFCEDIKRYGYEDTLFGVELEKRQISVKHIDNPIVHLGLEKNDEFLHKTEVALATLQSLDGRMNCYSRVQNMSESLRRWHLAPLFKFIFKLLRKPLRSNLLSHNPNLKLFALYKLGFYIELDGEKGAWNS